METQKIRYLVSKRQKVHTLWYWQPTKRLAAKGFRTVRLPSNFAEAAAEAERLNAELDAWYAATRKPMDESPEAREKRERVAARYRARKEELIALLGGCCVRCGATDWLQIDHADKTEKEFDVTSALTGKPLVAIMGEIRKCQLLCPPCHKEKHKYDRDNEVAQLYAENAELRNKLNRALGTS